MCLSLVTSIGRRMIRLGVVQHGAECVGLGMHPARTSPRRGFLKGRINSHTSPCLTCPSDKPSESITRMFNSSSAALASSKSKNKGKHIGHTNTKKGNNGTRKHPKRKHFKMPDPIELQRKETTKKVPPAYLTRTASPYVYIARSAIMNDMTGQLYVDPLTLYSELYTSTNHGDGTSNNKSPTKRRNTLPHIFRHSHLQYFSPATFPNHEPPTDGTPEVAFLGRSNTGKSSLINALHSSILRSGGGPNHGGSGGGELARTSKTPGRTQTINYFGLIPNGPAASPPNAKLFLVDLPGFGYASAPDESVDEWQKRTQQFLISRTLPLPERGGIQPWQSVAKPKKSGASTGNQAHRKSERSPPLKRLYLLLDSRLPEPTLLDLSVMGWCDDYSIPYTLVLTKVDGTSRAHCVKLTNQLCMRYHSLLLDRTFSEDVSEEDENAVCMDPVVYWTSAKDGLGMEELLLGVEGALFEADGDDDESDMLGG
ncbi:hypothetical protein ACHAWX_007226, partial [Stephanocyclus meneghinianus]